MKGDFGEEIRAKVEEIKDQIQADYDKTKKKKDPELDRSQIKVRLPEEMVVRLLKLKLGSPGCLNKGFILDGYPKTYNELK